MVRGMKKWSAVLALSTAIGCSGSSDTSKVEVTETSHQPVTPAEMLPEVDTGEIIDDSEFDAMPSVELPDVDLQAPCHA